MQELEHFLEKLEDENSALSTKADGFRRKRKDLEDKTNVDRAALKLKLEALLAKRQKLDEALTAVKLCEEEKLNTGRSLAEKISNSNNKITKLNEQLEKYDREIVTNMAKKEGFVQNQSQIDYLRSSISTMQNNRISSEETYNKAISGLNLKISVAQSQLQGQAANCKYEGTNKNSEKLDIYKYDQQKMYQQNENDYKQILERFKTKCVTLQNLLQEENNSLSYLDHLISEKKTLYDLKV